MSLFSSSPRGRNNPPVGARAAATMPADPTSAVRDPAHIGDIVGALGTIDRRDTGQGASWWQRLRMLLVIMGPGLIVMVGDNDPGGVATYGPSAAATRRNDPPKWNPRSPPTATSRYAQNLSAIDVLCLAQPASEEQFRHAVDRTLLVYPPYLGGLLGEAPRPVI
jgi:hypothetical protein